MSVEAGIEVRFQGTPDRTFDILKIEFSLKKTEDTIGGHDTAYAGNFMLLKFTDNLHQLSRWAVRQRPQLVEHFVGQSKKARQPRLRGRHSCAAKKAPAPRRARPKARRGSQDRFLETATLLPFGARSGFYIIRIKYLALRVSRVHFAAARRCRHRCSAR